MLKFCSKLKTSDKINFLFSLFNFVSLLILLFAINIIYFFMWYSHQKEMSLTSIEEKYIEFKKDNNLEKFKNYILKNDTIIIPEEDKKHILCSNTVEKKVHNTILTMKNASYYRVDGKIYLIYSQKYPEIGEIKILFNTTMYIESQLMIIKISLFLILISLFFYILIGRKITKYALKNLADISKKAGELDIEKDFEKLKISGNKDDEINILASKINDSFCHIKKQTSNLKQFITDVSHEFKTPLMVINSQIDVYNKKIEKNKLEKKDTNILLENIKEKTKKLDNLLETFLFLSRIENKIEKLEKKEVNFSNYLENFTKNYLENNEIVKNIGSKQINIKYKIEKNIFINLEKNTFNILFGNLISNAIKFSKNNDIIKLEIGLNKKSFWIKDNGCGIKKEKIGSIFNKFSREDNKIEGFGVGLFLVKRLIELYSWEIQVKSEAGKGSEFRIITK